MIQSVKHGVGKLDHINTTYKNLPERMPNSFCQEKFGFDNIELLKKYQILPEEKKEFLLKSTIDSIKGYFENLEIKYTTFENKGNQITITYSKILKEKREHFGRIISKILDQIKNRILNFNFNQDYFTTGNMKLRFHIKNCGMIIDKQKEKENQKMSSQNTEKEENVITKPNEDQENVMTNKQKEKNVITKKKKDDFIHLRISTDNKSKIQEKAEELGYKSVSKYIIEVMTNSKNVITIEETKIENNMKHRLLHDKIDRLEKDHALLLKFIKIFFLKEIETDDEDLTEEDIELIKKHSEDALKNA